MKNSTIPMNETTRVLSLQLSEVADNLRADIKEKTGEDLAFTLMIFTEGRAQYISTTDRATSIEQIENMLDYWKRDLPDVPAHEIN